LSRLGATRPDTLRQLIRAQPAYQDLEKSFSAAAKEYDRDRRDSKAAQARLQQDNETLRNRVLDLDGVIALDD